MFGAIAGDVIGSVFERANFKNPDFEPLIGDWCHPTDDTVLTCAVAEWIMAGAGDDLPERLKLWFRRFPHAGYGGTFVKWASSTSRSPYNSWGNGAAMRVSPVGFACTTLDETLDLARRSAEVTHDHAEGIHGAQATAGAVFLARSGHSKADIRHFVEAVIGYSLKRSLDEIRPGYCFDVSCQGSVPEAITAFLESTSWEDAVRNAISLGGDSDTIACIAGGIAAAHYGGVPRNIRVKIEERLAPEMLTIVKQFLLSFPSAG